MSGVWAVTPLAPLIINIYRRSEKDELGVDDKHKTISSVFNIST